MGKEEEEPTFEKQRKQLKIEHDIDWLLFKGCIDTSTIHSIDFYEQFEEIYDIDPRLTFKIILEKMVEYEVTKDEKHEESKALIEFLSDFVSDDILQIFSHWTNHSDDEVRKLADRFRYVTFQNIKERNKEEKEAREIRDEEAKKREEDYWDRLSDPRRIALGIIKGIDRRLGINLSETIRTVKDENIFKYIKDKGYVHSTGTELERLKKWVLELIDLLDELEQQIRYREEIFKILEC